MGVLLDLSWEAIQVAGRHSAAGFKLTRRLLLKRIWFLDSTVILA